MTYLHKDLGYLGGDKVVEVTLDKAANVRLMDGSNFSAYRAGRSHRCHGGYMTRSPVTGMSPSTSAATLGGSAPMYGCSVEDLQLA